MSAACQFQSPAFTTAARPGASLAPRRCSRRWSVAASAQQQQQQQQQTTPASVQLDDRRASSSQAGTSSSPAASASSLERLLPREDSSGDGWSGDGGGNGNSRRNTAVDARYQPFLDEWDKGFVETQEEPEGYWMECVQGAVPQGLRGTLFRNGPGRFTVGQDPIDHPYDGDGLVLSIAFPGDGRAFFRSRFVRTAEFQAESAEQRILFRGTFATQRPGGPAHNALDVYVKNTSNTNVQHWGGRLWTLFEAGQPHRLDPATLQTQGLETLDGKIRAGLPFDLGSEAANRAFGGVTQAMQERAGAAQHMPEELYAAGGDAVTAHPHVDPATGRLVTFSYRVGPSARPPFLGTELTFWELDQDFGVAAWRSFELAGFAFLHDFALTESYFVVFQNPVTVDNLPYLLGRAPAAACVRWVSGRPTLLHLIPRPGRTDAQGRPLQARCFELPPLFVFHHANAFETDGGSKIVVDSIHYDSLPAVGREALAEQQIDPDAAFRCRLRRVELDMDTGVLRISSAFNEHLEMVAINEQRWARPHLYVYGYASQFDNPSIGIAKVDTAAGTAAVWRPGFQRFALEPKFVPRPGASAEDDGWLLSCMFHSGTGVSQLVILDARDVEKGPVAVLQFCKPVPSGLHGCWTDVCYAPA
ncbi:hypothetical protein ABPG75_009981 [Micractinium tetrahymenae]